MLALAMILVTVILSYFHRFGLKDEMTHSVFRAFLQLLVVGFVL